MTLYPLLPALALSVWAGPKIVVTTPDVAAVVREVAGDAAEVSVLASPHGNPHHLDPRPSHVAKLMKADLFVQNGLELEVGWAPTLLAAARNRRVMPGQPGFLDASDAVEPLEVPANPSRAEGDVHPGGNPHYLLFPENAAKVALLTAGRLAELDPAQAEAYHANAAAFAERLAESAVRWERSMAGARDARYVAYHRFLSYFNARFGLEQIAELEPLPGIPPTARHTEAVVALMREKRARAVIVEPWYEKRTPGAAAAATGARLASFPPFPGAAGSPPDYFGWMDAVVASFAGALTPVPSGAAR